MTLNPNNVIFMTSVPPPPEPSLCEARKAFKKILNLLENSRRLHLYLRSNFRGDRPLLV